MVERCPYCGSPMRGNPKRSRHVPITAVDLDSLDDADPIDPEPDEQKDDKHGS